VSTSPSDAIGWKQSTGKDAAAFKKCRGVFAFKNVNGVADGFPLPSLKLATVPTMRSTLIGK
jgi:hypothetical protein